MTKAQEQIEQLIHLLHVEKTADYEQYQQKMLNTSVDERRKKGVTWYPIVISEQFLGTGDRFTLTFERTSHFKERHAFQVGAVVSLFSGAHEQEHLAQGVVSYVRENRIRVVLNGSQLPEGLRQGKLGLNLLFDEGSYKEMFRALKKVKTVERGRLADLREAFYGSMPLQFQKGFDYQSVYLNPAQNKALSHIFNAQDLAIVHGPPGTGKTTTLVHAIKEVVKQERQVMVCAQSNAAVDLLVEKLAQQGSKVLRIGHPARLSPEAIANSLDVKMEQHGLFKELKSVRFKHQQYKEMSFKYKRNFGHNERMQRDLLRKEARLYKEDAERIEQTISEDLMNEAEVVAATLVGCTHQLLADRTFKTVFIDEASQALEPAAWIAMAKAYRVVMAGDHLQLPPTVKSLTAAKEGLAFTLFERAIHLPEASVMLNVQYRMHPEIVTFSSDYFYEGALQTADEVLLREQHTEKPHFLWIDTAGTGFNEALNPQTLSTFNPEEAAFVLQHLQKNPVVDAKIGIIAPYKAQVELLKKLWAEGGEYDGGMHVTINTVDAFQGQECDVIYISLTRSNNKNEIGFLREYRRMNVAMTRAKSRLVIVGDSSTLGSDSFYKAVLDYAERVNAYCSAFELISSGLD